MDVEVGFRREKERKGSPRKGKAKVPEVEHAKKMWAKPM